MNSKHSFNKLVAVVTVLLSFVAVSSVIRESNGMPVREETTQAAETTESPYEYLVRAGAQNLELFCMSSGVWEKVTDFPVALADLPEIDREYLAAGIALRDAEELQRALEDYLPNS